MIAGTLTELIEIYEPQVTINDYGEQTTDYILKYNTRARLLHNGGSRTVANGSEIVYPYRKELAVRQYLNIDDFDRVKWNDKYYKILDITPNKHNQEQIINIELINE